MLDSTPYWDRPATERAHEQRCMRALLMHAPQVDFIWEAFGGLGETGSVLRELQPQARVQACELDAACAAAYDAKHGFGACAVGDARELVVGIPVRSGVSLDFNKLTIMDLRGRASGRWKVELMQRVISTCPAWVQVTDSAVRYLHLNWRGYRLTQPSAALYKAAWSHEVQRRWSYRVTHWEHYHAASYYLLEPVR